MKKIIFVIIVCCIITNINCNENSQHIDNPNITDTSDVSTADSIKLEWEKSNDDINNNYN